MKHIILGHSKDLHANHMLQRMRERGLQAHLIETHHFPNTLQLSLRPQDGGGTLRLADGGLIELAEIASVYWRNFCGVSQGSRSPAPRGSTEDIAYYDSMACLRAWFQAESPTRWYNSWAAFQSHQEKPHQLRLVAQAGVDIPRSYIGNDINLARAFCAQEGEVIFKPVYGGAHTERITLAHLDESHMRKALAQSPITLQQFVAGTNIRTYAIGERLFSAELHSTDIDFRTDRQMEITPIELPSETADQVPRIMRSLGLNWTAIDWRRDPDGRYYFLEANPSPMFIGVEKRTGFPLTDTLIAAMNAKG